MKKAKTETVEQEEILEYKESKVKISDLKFDDSNPNRLTAEQEDALKYAMKKFGYLVPILINEKMQIGDGEHRAKLYQKMGLKEIPAYVVPKINKDVERRLLRQTMNKLKGFHDNRLDADEMTFIYEQGKLDDLMLLVAQNQAEISSHIMRYSSTADKELLDKLFGGDSSLHGTNSLASRFGIPPFSILDATSATWRNRKRLWLEWGLHSESGREHLRYFNTRLLNNKSISISIFDPVLAEISYRWFAPKQNCKVLDPFSGGSVRGIIASCLGHEYVGVDIRPEQIEANEKEYLRMQDRMPQSAVIRPRWYVSDACEIDEAVKEREFDMLLTSPPYFQQEKYSDLKDDLNNLNLSEFFSRMSIIVKKSCSMLKKTGSFAIWNTSNTRDPKTGKIINATHHIIDEFQKHGFFLLNDLVLMRSVAGLQIMVNRQFTNRRMVGSRHESVLVFYRGKDKKDVPKLNTDIVEIPEPPQEDEEQI